MFMKTWWFSPTGIGIVLVLVLVLAACTPPANPTPVIQETATSTPSPGSAAATTPTDSDADETPTPPTDSGADETPTPPTDSDADETPTPPTDSDADETPTPPTDSDADETLPTPTVPNGDETTVVEGDEGDEDDMLPGEGKTVHIARATWDTGWFQAEVFKLLLERLGYTVSEIKTMQNEEFYQAAAQGKVDMWANGWFPLHTVFVENEPVQGKVAPVGYEVRAGALQGYLIDKKTAEEIGITSLEDLADPDIAEVFDRDGNGKADLIGCDPGWGCEQSIEHHLDTYGLRETVEHVQGNYSSLMAETIAYYQRGEPVLFYTWTPNWTIGMLVPGDDVVWIEVPYASLPAGQDEMEDLTIVIGVPGCVSENCNMGYPPNDIRVVANKAFLDENAAARKLFELVEIPLEDISAQNALMFEGEDSEDDLREHAEDWADDNRDIVSMWLEEARSAD
jgi:glycine betaine/proline transport system substrate-binding protein